MTENSTGKPLQPRLPPRTPEQRAAWLEEGRAHFEKVNREHPEKLARIKAQAAKLAFRATEYLAPSEFKRWFDDSQVVDAEGKPQ